MCIYTYTHTQWDTFAIKNEIMPFEATWMDLESTVLSEIRQRQILYITCAWNLIHDAHELIYKTETDSQT